jgi:hypothetical protein
MFIIPIIVKNIQVTDDSVMKQVWLFLERNGTQCIAVDSLNAANNFIKTNDFPLKTPLIVSGQHIYAVIDSSADVSSFYLWNEIRQNVHPMKEVWRSFIWIVGKDSEEDVWGTNTFLKEIVLTQKDSVHTILEGYFKR